jgi:hypothetical protein
VMYNIWRSITGGLCVGSEQGRTVTTCAPPPLEVVPMRFVSLLRQ